MKATAALIVTAVLLCIPVNRLLAGEVLSPQAADSLLSAGNRLYQDRDYAAAAACYERIIANGYASAELYYNLGNAWYKQDQMANAIRFYEKALLLKPGNEDIRQNLALANTRIIDKIDAIPVFFLRRWMNALVNLFAPNQWAIFNLTLFILALACLLWSILSSRYPVKRTTLTLGVLMLVITLAGMLSMRSRAQRILNSGSAIIMVSSVNAMSSPDEQSTSMFVLHEGAKVMLTDSVQNWTEIRIANGNKGWVRGEVLGEI